jgi:hypothetical protein
MKTIHKYEIPITGNYVEIELPEDFFFLSLQNQNDRCIMWGETDTNSKKEKIGFIVLGTGHDIERITENLKMRRGVYVGTVQIGAFVWHIFQALNAY